jgi:hypothetical protein
VPTIHHRARCKVVGTLRFAYPTDCGLIWFMHKRNLVQRRAANWHDRQITSDFQKLCQARKSKIFRFRSHANQSHNPACLTADEGRWPSSRTRGEMRWTWMAR